MKIRFSLHSRHASACQQLPLWLPSTRRPRKQAVLFKTWMTGRKLCKQKQESKFLTEAFHLFHWPLVAESSHAHPTNTPMAFSLAENHEKFPQASKANPLIRVLSSGFLRSHPRCSMPTTWLPWNPRNRNKWNFQASSPISCNTSFTTSCKQW